MLNRTPSSTRPGIELWGLVQVRWREWILHKSQSGKRKRLGFRSKEAPFAATPISRFLTGSLRHRKLERRRQSNQAAPSATERLSRRRMNARWRWSSPECAISGIELQALRREEARLGSRFFAASFFWADGGVPESNSP